MNVQQKVHILTEVINEFDPEELLEIGAPLDEYSSEIKDIAQYDIDLLSEEELSNLIRRVFKKWFGSTYTIEYCTKISKEIKDKLHTLN